MSIDDYSEGSPWKRSIVGAIILLAVLGGAYGAYLFFFGGEDSPTTTATTQEATATKGQLVSMLTTTGTAAAQMSSKLTFEGTGKVKSIGVSVGQQVTEGQELARLEDRDTLRKLEAASSNLAIAQLKLSDLLDPPSASDLASAEQSIASARNQLLTAQKNLDDAVNGPTASVLADADAAVLRAESSLRSAQNSVDTSWLSLLNAQKTYCQASSIVLYPCYESDLPLSANTIHDLTEWIRAPGGTTAQVGAATSAASSLIQSNASYLNTKGSVESAELALQSAIADRKDLTDPPDDFTLSQLRNALASAQAGLTVAEARLETLLKGATATEIALQSESLRSAQVAFEQAQEAVDALALKAPFAGTVGAVGITVGDQVSTSTAAFTITNPNLMRVDLTVSESDLGGLKAGQFGIATFDAISGRTFVVRITGVSTTATTTQGVVTYPVQAEILTGQQLVQYASELQKVMAAVQSGGSAAGTGGTASGTPRTGSPPAQGTPNAGGTPGAPPSGTTPGGRQAGGGAAATQTASMPAPGMSASVIVVTSITENALLVPSGAVKRSGRTSIVIVVKEDGTQEQRTVTVAGTNGTNSAISSGLTEGEKVLIGGTTTTGTTTTTAPQGNFGPGAPTPAGGVR